MFIETQRVSPNALVFSRKFSSTLSGIYRVIRNFPTFLTLDFPLLLVALGNRLKFRINLVQGFKKLLSGFLDLSL